MSNNRRRYRATKSAIKQLCTAETEGNLARRLNTLAALVSGIVGSKSTHLSAIAGKVPVHRTFVFGRKHRSQAGTAQRHCLPGFLLTGDPPIRPQRDRLSLGFAALRRRF